MITSLKRISRYLINVILLTLASPVWALTPIEVAKLTASYNATVRRDVFLYRTVKSIQLRATCPIVLLLLALMASLMGANANAQGASLSSQDLVQWANGAELNAILVENDTRLRLANQPQNMAPLCRSWVAPLRRSSTRRKHCLREAFLREP